MRIDELRGRFTAQLIAVSFAPMLIAGLKTPGTARECPVAWFEIASLKVSPSTIDVNGTPNAATVTAVVRAHGKLPSGAEARVEAYTNSAEPLKSNVAYSRFLTLPLNRDLTVFKFSVRPGCQTVAGTVLIRATIVDATSGVGFYGPGGTATVPLRITSLTGR